MSQIFITAHIVGQSVQMTNLPLLASGIEGALKIKCTFSEEWEGYAKTAVFYRNEEEVFHVLLTAGEATVPTEVLTDKGSFYFGIMGKAEGGLTLTTEVLRVNLVKGAVTTATADPSAPAPNIYEDLLSAYGRMDSRLDELVAMRGNGVTEQSIQGDCFRGTIYSNGASAFISIEFIDLPLTAGSERTDYCIMPAYAPLGQVTLNSLPNGPQATVTITPRSWSGTEWAGITITNPTGETLTEAVEFEGFYDLESMFNAELADVRVGADGVTYDTAGAAVRKQIMNIAKAYTPSFNEKGAVVSCAPVEGLPLDVVTHVPGEVAGATLTLYHTGKNLFDPNGQQIYSQNCSATYDGESLTLTIANATTGAAMIAFAIPHGDGLVGKTVTVSAEWGLSGENNGSCFLFWINESGIGTASGLLVAASVSGAPASAVIPEKPSGAGELGLLVYGNVYGNAKAGDTATFRNIQVEIGGNATSFEPYRGAETKTVTIPDAALEGTYNWGTGVLTEIDGHTTKLTPQPLAAFPGVNTLWSSAGETEVKGSADINGVIETLTNAIIALGGNI